MNRLPATSTLRLCGTSSSTLSSIYSKRTSPSTSGVESSNAHDQDMDLLDDNGSNVIIELIQYTTAWRASVLSCGTEKMGFLLMASGKDFFRHSQFWRQKLFNRFFPALSKAVIHNPPSEQKGSFHSRDGDVLTIWALCGFLVGSPLSIIGSTEIKPIVIRVLILSLSLSGRSLVFISLSARRFSYS